VGVAGLQRPRDPPDAQALRTEPPLPQREDDVPEREHDLRARERKVRAGEGKVRAAEQAPRTREPCARPREHALSTREPRARTRTGPRRTPAAPRLGGTEFRATDFGFAKSALPAFGVGSEDTDFDSEQSKSVARNAVNSRRWICSQVFVLR